MIGTAAFALDFAVGYSLYPTFFVFLPALALVLASGRGATTAVRMRKALGKGEVVELLRVPGKLGARGPPLPGFFGAPAPVEPVLAPSGPRARRCHNFSWARRKKGTVFNGSKTGQSGPGSRYIYQGFLIRSGRGSEMEGTQAATKSPMWLRIVEIAFGLSAIGLVVPAMIYPPSTLFAIALLFAFALLVIGFAMIGSGFDRRLPGGLRALNLVIGFLAIPFAFWVLVYPPTGVFAAMFLLAFFLIIRGIGGIAVGAAAQGMPGWMRGVMIAVGILAISISMVILVYPVFDLEFMVALFAIALLFLGLESLVAGATGKPMRRTMPKPRGQEPAKTA